MYNDSTNADGVQRFPLVKNPATANVGKPGVTDDNLGDETNARHAAALALAQRGFRVFPVIENDKRPYIEEWPEWATRDAKRIRAVWGKYPKLNIGCLNDDLFSIDVDTKAEKQGAKSLALLEALYEGLPLTYSQRSASGGYHFTYRAPPQIVATIKTCANKIVGFPDIDVRAGRTGYIVGAGSSTAGGEYTVEKDLPIADAPPWLIDFLPKVHDRKTTENGDGQTPLVELDADAAIARATDYLLRHAPEAIEGAGGDAETLKVAMRVKDFGVSQGRCFELILDHWNDTKASPPWEPDELAVKVANAYRYGQDPPGIASAEAEFEPVEIDSAKPSPPTRRGLVYIDWHETKALLDRPYLIDDVIDAGAMVVTYGDSNAGKTYVVLDQCFHIASGKDWNGHKVQQGLVVYVAAEGGTGFFKRIEAFKRHYGVKHLPFVTIPCPIDLQSDNADARRLIEVIQEAETRHSAKCVAVIVDTLARAMAGGDENTAVDMGKFVAHADRIRAATGATVNIIHHTGKDKAKGARGSSALRAATDTEIEIDVGKLAVTKQRDMERISEMRFELVPVEIGQRSDGRGVTACVVDWLSDAEVDFAAPIDGKQQEALTAFENALAAKGQNATVASFTEWQTAYTELRAARGKKTGEKPALVRCSKALVGAGYIAKTSTGQYVRTSAK